MTGKQSRPTRSARRFTGTPSSADPSIFLLDPHPPGVVVGAKVGESVP
jgi:hypothetical protein